MADEVSAAHAHYTQLTEAWLEKPGVDRGTMMGFPCLRVNGGFFASIEHKGSGLVVKLPAARVSELILAEAGEPFAPNGRRFKEWLRVPYSERERWPAMLDEALAFVGG